MEMPYHNTNYDFLVNIAPVNCNFTIQIDTSETPIELKSIFTF